jgi:hypothetical protein
MSFTVSAANTYFDAANHVLGHLWDPYSVTQKTAAIATSERMLSRWLRTDITAVLENSLSYQYPDRAVFEQALFEVVNSTLPDGDLAGPKYIDIEMEAEGGLYIEATRWLPNVDLPPQVVRG